MGLTTLLVAWVGWIGSLHGGQQATNYTESNNLASQGTAAYNMAAQLYIADLFTWNTILDLKIDLEAAREQGNTTEAKLIEHKIQKIKQGSCSPKLLEALNNDKDVQNGMSPFENEAFTKSYFEEADKLLAESQKRLEEGKNDNLRDDSFSLVSVIYSLVLFLLGIVGVLKDHQSRKALFIFSACLLIIGMIYMFTLPMPTDFDISSFFNTK